ADFDGDGIGDLLFHDSATGEVQLWLMFGTLPGAKKSLGIVNPISQIHGIGDFNNDGKADILWENTHTLEQTIWLMDGATKIDSIHDKTLSTFGRMMGEIGRAHV